MVAIIFIAHIGTNTYGGLTHHAQLSLIQSVSMLAKFCMAAALNNGQSILYLVPAESWNRIIVVKIWSKVTHKVNTLSKGVIVLTVEQLALRLDTLSPIAIIRWHFYL